MKHVLFALLILCVFSLTAIADNWPQWRGPGNNPVVSAGDYPLQFSAEENVVWKIELPGKGSSTPAVWGEQIFVTCAIDGQDGIVCYDFAGKELWRKEFGDERKGKHANGSGSNPSPVTDGKHVVAYYKSGTVACLNLAGEMEWQINLQELYGKDTLWWDLGTSPVLAGGNVIVAVMQAGESFLVALDLDNGDIAWKQDRTFDRPQESDQSYTTPCVMKVDGREVLITWGADYLTGNDTASGEPLWQCGGFNPEDKKMWRSIASAAVDQEVAVVPYGRGKFIAGVQLSKASGDITKTHRLWEKARIGTDVPTPVIFGDSVLVLGDKGTVTCLEKMTGKLLWDGKLPKAKAKYYSSPMLAGNKLYCAREDGVIISATIDVGLHNIHKNDMGESIIATLVPLDGKLLVRGEEHLFLLGK